jgi:hypothetical protein
MPRRSKARRAPAVLPRYLLSGLALWAVALLVNLDGAVRAVRVGTAGAGALDATHDALVVALTTGGLSLIALGMSLRVVAGWLDLPEPDLRRAGRVWLPLAAATLLRALRPGGAALSPALGDLLGVAGNVLWAGAALWYLPALRGLWAPGAVRPGGGPHGEADPPLAWFVRLAYAWLAATAVLAGAEALLLTLGSAGPASALADAGRHALLFGFLGVLTAGLSGRLPSAFLEVGERGLRASRGAYAAAFWALAVATTLRVAAPLGGDWRSAALVVAGAAGAAGLGSLLVAQLQLARAARAAGRPSAG